MKAAPGPNAATTSALHAALLDYFGSPGKYQLALRQPALLFGSVREVLQIAAGRGETAPPTADGEPRLQEAAAFFLRAALLYPGADHYAVLGYAPRSEPAGLKERYRLLMRLIHPDFAGTATAGWPADAAVRVNLAYEVLSSEAARAEYDAHLSADPSGRAAVSRGTEPRRPPAVLQDTDTDTTRARLRMAWAFGAGAAIVGVLLVFPRGEPVALVQKPQTVMGPPAQVAATLSPPNEVAAALVRAGNLSASSLETVQAPALPAPLASAAQPTLPAQPSAPSRPQATPSLPAPPKAPSQAAAPPPAVASVAPARTPATLSVSPGAAPRTNPPPPSHAAELPAARAAPAIAMAMASVAQPPEASVSSPRPPAMPVAQRGPATEVAQAPAPASASQDFQAAAVRAAVPPPVRGLTPGAPALPPGPTLADAQPLLTQLLQMLEAGSGDQLLRLLEGEARHAPSAQAFARNYDQLVQGTRPVRLTHVEFKGEPRDGSLLVTGRIRLHVGEPTIGSHGEKLLVRAEFTSGGGRVILKGLSGARD